MSNLEALIVGLRQRLVAVTLICAAMTLIFGYRVYAFVSLRSSLTQAVSNLLDNAIHYNRENGSIRING